MHNHVSWGHTSVEAEKIVLKTFHLGTEKELHEALTKLHRLCLHCDRFLAIARRSLYSTPHGRRPNEVLHGDYLRVENGYLLTLVDDF